MKHQFLALALVAGFAHADNISLFRAPNTPPTPAYQAALEAKYGGGYKVTPISINRFAVNATVITAEIEGKPYRFVGKTSTMRTKDFVTYDSWRGISANGDVAKLEFRDAVFQYGLLDLDGDHYSLRPDAIVDMKGGFSPEIRVAARRAWALRDTETSFVPSGGQYSQYVGYCGTEKVLSPQRVRNCAELHAKQASETAQARLAQEVAARELK